MANQNALTTPTLISNGEDVSASVTNRIVSNSGGLLDTVTVLSNHREVTSGNSTVNVVANQDVMIFCNNTSNIVANLPPCAGQLVTKKIRFRKTVDNYARVTITANGADVIENPYSPAAVPVNTTFLLLLPGEEYELVSNGNVWRVAILNSATQMYRASAYLAANQTLTAGSFDRINMGVENFDLGGFYNNTTTFRFTPLINGIYFVKANVAITNNATANNFFGIVQANGSNVDTKSNVITQNANATGDAIAAGSYTTPMNGSTDYLQLHIFSGLASRQATGVASYTNMTVSLVSRL